LLLVFLWFLNCLIYNLLFFRNWPCLYLVIFKSIFSRFYWFFRDFCSNWSFLSLDNWFWRLFDVSHLCFRFEVDLFGRRNLSFSNKFLLFAAICYSSFSFFSSSDFNSFVMNHFSFSIFSTLFLWNERFLLTHSDYFFNSGFLGFLRCSLKLFFSFLFFFYFSFKFSGLKRLLS